MDPKIKRFLAALLLWAMVLSLGVGRESAAAADPAGELTQGDYDRADRVLLLLTEGKDECWKEEVIL